MANIIVQSRRIWTRQPTAAVAVDATLGLVPWVGFIFTDIKPRNFGAVGRELNWSLYGTPTVSITRACRGISNTGYASAGRGHEYGISRSFDGFSPASSPAWFCWSFVHSPFVNYASSRNILWQYGSIDSGSGFIANFWNSNVLRVVMGNTELVGPTLVADSEYRCVAGRDKDGLCWLWVNGNLVASGSGALAADSASARVLTFLGDSSQDRRYRGSLNMFAMGSENPVLVGKRLSSNPYLLIRRTPRRTIISLGASSDLEISATLGTASADGHAANINLSREIAAQTTTATASGNAASIDLHRNVSATVATATASGFNANVNMQLAIDATLATANASGYSVGVDLRRNVSATLATATALGNTTNVNLQRQIIATLGTASAIGYGASIETAGITNIQATLGTATASGYSANINLQKEIAANLSVASAIGYQANIEFASVLRIPATLATASASGYISSIDRQTGINTTIATAGAFGYDAIINSSATKFTPIDSAYSTLDIAYNYNVLSIDKDYNIWQVN